MSGKSLQFLLSGQGFDVVLAASLAEALPLLDSSFSHALVDLMLPDGDGSTILRYIRQNNLPIWTGVITGVSDPDRIKALTPFQPKLLLRKPIDVTELFQALK